MPSSGICQGKVEMVTNGCKKKKKPKQKKPAFKLNQNRTKQNLEVYIFRQNLSYVLFLTAIPQHGKKENIVILSCVLYCSPSMAV